MNNRAMLLFIPVLAAAVVLQVTVLPVFLLPAFKPDLLLVLMIFMALRGPTGSGALLSWLLGALSDVFSGLYLGLNAVTYLVVFLVIKGVSDRLYAESALLFVLTTAGVTLAVFTLNMILLLMFTATPGIAYSMFTDIVPRLLVNCFVASLVTLLPGFDRNLEIA
ncbi:MAG TPA: rod shape-determining protein MreD [Desulfuromonadales bacterium]|nr:rod shape-determining protein MreD [Desulfuromonadales bacterium]